MKVKTDYEIWEEEYNNLSDKTTEYLLLPFYGFSQLCRAGEKKSVKKEIHK